MSTIKNPCILCEIGCDFTQYHKERHLLDPKKVDDFNDKLLKEPLEEFTHPPFNYFDDIQSIGSDIEFIDDDDDDDDIDFSDCLDYEDMNNITYLDKTI